MLDLDSSEAISISPTLPCRPIRNLRFELHEKTLLVAAFPAGWDPATNDRISFYREVIRQCPGQDNVLVLVGGEFFEVSESAADFEAVRITRAEAQELGAEAHCGITVLDPQGRMRFEYAGANPPLEEIVLALRPGLSRRELFAVAMAATLAASVLPITLDKLL